MSKRITTAGLLLLLCSVAAPALEPEEILVLVNRSVPESSRLGRYYCEKRSVPYKNILYLHLTSGLNENISRGAYEQWIAEPVRMQLLRKRTPGEIRCLVTTYGVPIRVGRRPPLEGQEARLKELEEKIKNAKDKLDRAKQADSQEKKPTPDELKRIKLTMQRLQLQADRINGRETDASVDSELSLALVGDYELYRWQPNGLRGDTIGLDFKTLMVSRLDASSYEIAEGLVDKAIEAEKNGLKGTAYIDTRGMKFDRTSQFSFYDQSMRDMAILTRLQTEMAVKEEKTSKLFDPCSCPDAAIYCGWYSLGKYIDAFDFVQGAVGYHIASSEATGLRSPNGSQWCTAMLRDGITATLGPVNEPYLHSFPLPRDFFAQLYKGKCLVEAYYHTKPFNSWMLLLIGDPLYTPFPKNQSSPGAP